MNGTWKATRLRFLLDAPLTYGATESGIEFDVNLPRYIRITDIRADGRLEPENVVSLPYETARPYLLKDGDVLLARSGATVGKAFLYQADSGEACFAGYLIRARCHRQRILPEYLSYFLQSASYWDFINRSALQATIQNVSAEVYKEVSVTHPSTDRQAAVVTYLDEQTEKIDRLMDMRRRQMALLKEQRSALIQQAVTCGLNPNVPMKDSGLPWLGEIPEHWEVTQVRHLLSFVTSGSRGWAEFYSDDGDIFVQSGNLSRDMALNLDNAQRIQLPAGAEGERSRLNQNDVLICVTGALTGNVAFVNFQPPIAYVNQHVALLRPKEKFVTPKFLATALWSIQGQIQFKLAEYGGTKQGLSLNDLRLAWIALPSKSEQVEILDFIQQESERIDQAFSTYDRQITLLAEYRAALIHECVTGQRLIPEAASL